MKTSLLTPFRDAALIGLNTITGGGASKDDYPTKDDCTCPSSGKGNNGIGQEKRGILDGPPPGLAKQIRLDFNDRTGNRHGVEVDSDEG